MKVHRALTILAFVMAFAATWLFWRAGLESEPSVVEAPALVARIKQEFVATTKPVYTLPLGQLTQTRVGKELTDPKTAFPHTHLFKFQEIAALSKYANTCQNLKAVRLHDVSLEKALSWHRFLCGDIKTLPNAFFARPPFVHPSGASYVALAENSGRPEFLDPQWKHENANRLHLIEAVQSSSPTANLSGPEISRLLRGDELVLNPEFVLVASTKSGEANPEIYLSFPRKDWDTFVTAKSLVAVVNDPGLSCTVTDGSVCWTQNPARKSKNFRLMAFLFAGAFLLLGATVLLGRWKRAKQVQLESERRLFTLQMLTHELRTPATSLRLSTEALRSQFDAMPSESQKAFLRICEDLQRLDRIVEASQSYLRSEVGGDLLDTSSSETVTANQLLSAILEPYDGRITFRPLEIDRPLRIKRYWIEICIKNLVENALAHGKPPVRVVLTANNSELVITVQDGGEVAFEALDEMAVAFKKGRESHGLGLGLTIVQTVVGSMNGELEFSSAPTAFLIKLKDFA